MGGDFVIGIIVFLILVTINFLVITKGATRIAEVGARFTLDAIPGKQMAIDADLSAGLIDEKIAQQRRRELEEESAFFGSMDGASKFVRGDAIAGLIILAVNIFGGIVIGVTRHGLSLSAAADIFTKLSVGDGLVSQIPALIISLAAGMLVAKGGTRGSADKAVLGQLSDYPDRAVHGGAADVRARRHPRSAVPSVRASRRADGLRRRRDSQPPGQGSRHRGRRRSRARGEGARRAAALSIKEQLKSAEIELCLSKELTATLLAQHDEIAVARRQDAAQVRARNTASSCPRSSSPTTSGRRPRPIRSASTARSSPPRSCESSEFLVIVGDGKRPNVPGDEVREPAFGMKAMSISQAYLKDVKREGFKPIDAVSVLLTHLSEVIHNNLAQLLSYKDMRAPARSAGAGIQAAGRRAVPVADLLFRHCRRCSSCCSPSACRSATSI